MSNGRDLWRAKELLSTDDAGYRARREEDLSLFGASASNFCGCAANPRVRESINMFRRWNGKMIEIFFHYIFKTHKYFR